MAGCAIGSTVDQRLKERDPMTPNLLKFYIDGAFVDPVEPRTIDVVDPSTEEAFATVALGSEADVDRAVAAARAAFETFALTSR
jgi:aldehyde dehydrogenase (NAD+)